LTVEDRTDSRRWEERFDKCILATGATARRLEVEGQDAKNVFTFRELMDADAVRKAVELRDVNHAVVVGGGYVGVEVAEALTRQGIRTTILDRNGQVLQKYLSGDLNQQVADELLTHGVTVRHDSVEKIVPDDSGKVASLWTKAGERIGCQLVIVAIGVVPNTSLADEAGIRIGKSGGVKVDSAMRTSSPRIWACGDCIEVERIVDKKAIPSTLATTAYRTARVAGHNAARQGIGKPQVFDGVSPASAVKVFNLEVATAGLSLADATASGFDAISSVIQSWSRVKMYPGAEKIFVDMIVEKRSGRLLGVQMVGREGVVQRCNVLIAPIREGWSVSKVKNIDLIYAPPFGPSLDPVIVAARQSEKKAIV
jgi:NADPH-dependent 2,4-dienoyl-CoA reductase/sulfur reductase-like enzyme